MSVLEQVVYAGGRSKPFGELTASEVAERANELRDAAAAGGPATRVLPVAMAWGELGRTMSAAGAATVADLGEDVAAQRAEKLWVVPPGGSLLA